MTVDQAPFQEKLSAAQSQLARDKALHEFKKAEADRHNDLIKEGAVSRSEYDKYRTDEAAQLAVIRADNEVDVEFKSIIRQLITHMMEDPRTITTSIEIISIARAIERIGDHAKNISEQVIFVVEGRDIRHNKEAIK